MNAGLFDEVVEKGFHLEFFQLCNWGVFDKKIYTLDASSKSTLLTGVNGSGKTTLVDAITTLLVPPQLRFYNQSSGSTKKKDRSEESYVLGAYGSLQEEGSGLTQYLRKKEDTISLLNGCFRNSETGACLSLLQVRWYSGAELQRHFAVTEQRLGLEDLYAALEKAGVTLDRGGKWKRIASSVFATVFYDSFEKYRIKFSESFGLRSEKALKLFSQIIGLKVLGNLTDFIRENMLERTNADTEFQNLEMNYTNLIQSERLILKTKKQIELLEPIIEMGKKLEEANKELERLSSLRDAVPAWRAERAIAMLQKEGSRLEQELSLQRDSGKRKALEAERLEGEIRSLQADIDNTESAHRIAQIDGQISTLEEEKERKAKNSREYGEKAAVLALQPPHTAIQFEKQRTELQALEEKLEQKQAMLSEKDFAIKSEKKDIEKAVEEIKSELASLGERNSNIPLENIRIRRELCTALRKSEEELPFAGELLRVANGEEQWNFAIERLLHSFALDILVPEGLYKKVTDYVKSHDMGGRIVYLKTEESFSLGQDILEQEAIIADRDSVPGKLEVKQGHPLTQWLSRYLYEHYNYVCTDDTSLIARVQKALTSTALIKNASRHEKDDRKSVRQQFSPVLGWDNTRKKQLLSSRLDDWNEKLAENERTFSTVSREADIYSRKLFALHDLKAISSWEEMDADSVARRIDALQSERKKLANQKDIKEKQALLDAKKEDKRMADADKERILLLIGKLENQYEGVSQKLSENEALWQDLSGHSDFAQAVVPAIAGLCAQYPRLTAVQTVPELEASAAKILAELNGNITTAQRSINAYTTNIGSAMAAVKNPSAELRKQYDDWSSEFADMGATKEFLADYEGFYKRLKKDDLPKYQKRFHDYLHTSIRDDIINFNEFINNAKTDIESAVRYLNQNLRRITYQQNPDTYLELKCERSKDGRIDEFVGKLRNAIPDSVRIQQEDSAYEEALFARIKAFLESLKENQTLRDYVLDVRNWFRFAASENYVQDGAQKKYYNDSAGLSGGEKAKLTYTVLASAISYQFGINAEGGKSFRFVIIDEAFSKSDAANSEYAMKLFEQLDLQVMVITPLDKINIVEDYISSVHITENKHTRDSRLISMSIEKYRAQKSPESRLGAEKTE